MSVIYKENNLNITEIQKVTTMLLTGQTSFESTVYFLHSFSISSVK